MNADAPRVYIVEDDEAVRESLQLMLESVGYKTRTYTNANTFLDEQHNDMAG